MAFALEENLSGSDYRSNSLFPMTSKGRAGSGAIRKSISLGAWRMPAVAGDFRFIGARFLTELTAVFFARRRNANAGLMGAFPGTGCHRSLLGQVDLMPGMHIR